jgi:predicted Zn-dependent peptidase
LSCQTPCPSVGGTLQSTLRKAAWLLLLLALPAIAQDVVDFEKRTTVRTLKNGLTVVIVERPGAPVFSYFTHVDAGSVQEPLGKSGLAHMFEHMAFKGTDTIGTKNWPAEKAALARVEKAYAAYEAERRKPEHVRDDKKLAAFKQAWQDAMKAADEYVIPNQFDELVQKEGGVGMNAFTSNDETGYFYSLPVNRLEYWAWLESERMMKTVMREFYKERDVVWEERRMRVDSSPIGRAIEQFVAAAFVAHPYHLWGIGWPSEIESWSATDAAEFYRRYYVPENMVVTVVGAVKAAQAMPIIEKYFGRMPASPEPLPLPLVEPPQIAEKTIVLKDQAQPLYIEGYHRPAITHPDNAIYDVISDIMSKGRTSRLYKSLVRDKKIAAVAQGFNGFPGEKYPNLFAFFAIPTRGHNPPELRAAIHDEIERLKKEEVTDEELQSVKTRAKADLIRSLDSNMGLALGFGTAQARFGDWRAVFRNVEAIDKVTKADIRRVANEVFKDTNRTSAMIENVQAATAKPATPAKEGDQQ